MATHILRIDASARTAGSVTRDLNDQIAARYIATGNAHFTTRVGEVAG